MLPLGPQLLTVVSVSSTDRKVFATAAISATADSVVGPENGRAWLVTEDNGWFPVVVAEAAPGGTQVVIADELPREITARAAFFSWADWYAAIGAADVTATAQRNVLWRVTFNPLVPGEAFAGPDSSGIEEGRIHVVRRPFETGLSSTYLKGMFPQLAQMVHHRQQDWGPQIAAARNELVNRLRAELRERSLWEDDIDGRPLLESHAYYAAAMVLDTSDSERAAAFRTRADALAETALKSVWIDLDSDGVVDEGEDAQQITGTRVAYSGGSFSSSEPPAFTIGQNH